MQRKGETSVVDNFFTIEGEETKEKEIVEKLSDEQIEAEKKKNKII